MQERNQQVQMMRRIYMAATRVLSFVGSEVRDVDIGLDFVDFLNLKLSKEKWLPLVRHHKYEKQWKAIESLWNQEYWKRVWIVQEVVAASKIVVCYGTRTIEWEKFSRVIKQLVDLSESGELRGYISMLRFTGPAMLDRLRRRREESGKGWPLATLLQLCMDAQSTDRRDKIYGLLGLQDPITDDDDISCLRIRMDHPITDEDEISCLQIRLRERNQLKSYRNEIVPAYARGTIYEWEMFFRGGSDAPRIFPRINGIEADYTKSALELWEEVMLWPSLWDDFHLLQFSQLVQEVLGSVPKHNAKDFMVQPTINNRSSTSRLSNSDVLGEKGQPSQKFSEKQKAGISDNPAGERIQKLYYTAGICRSTILFLGPPYSSITASVKLLRQWIKLYFHPTKKLNNTGKLPPSLLAGGTQAENDLHKVNPIQSPRSYAEIGGWAYVSHVEKELDSREVDISSLQIIDEDLGLKLEEITSSLKSSPGPPTLTTSKQPRWFISDRGQIGLAPYSAEEGDLVCQFKWLVWLFKPPN